MGAASFLLLASLASAAPQGKQADLKGPSAQIAGQLRDEVEATENDIGEEALEQGGKGSETLVERLTDRLGRLKADKKVGAAMHPVLERLAEAVRTIPNRDYAKKHPAEIARALAGQLEADAAASKTADELNERLKKSLVLPENLKGDLPTNLSLENFKKLGPVVIFLLKHRTSAPEGFADITEEDLRDGRYPVEIGVRYRGVVQAVFDAEDGDYCWNMSIIHNEIPPGWANASGECHPEVGDTVELRGWSYFDVFHQSESKGEKEFNKGRPTVWEVHPVTGCTILAKAKEKLKK